jgi:hypothetical protein
VKAERTMARAACPSCSAERVAIVRSPNDQHLVWKFHNLVTFMGTRLPCGTSAQHLCDAPPRETIGYDTPHCTHR